MPSRTPLRPLRAGSRSCAGCAPAGRSASRSPAEIRERLARSGLFFELPAAEDLDRHLDQLAEWKNLQRSHDTGAVSRIDDFYRRRYLYRLTPEGEAAHRAVREVEATVGRSGALQTSMLVEIRDALAALVPLTPTLSPASRS